MKNIPGDEEFELIPRRQLPAYLAGVCLNTVDSLIAQKKIDSVRIGRQVFVTKKALRRYLNGEQPEKVDEVSESHRSVKDKKILMRRRKSLS